jgi:hypothetical protein
MGSLSVAKASRINFASSCVMASSLRQQLRNGTKTWCHWVALDGVSIRKRSNLVDYWLDICWDERACFYLTSGHAPAGQEGYHGAHNTTGCSMMSHSRGSRKTSAVSCRPRGKAPDVLQKLHLRLLAPLQVRTDTFELYSDRI